MNPFEGDEEIKKILSRYKVKSIPESLMKNYEREVRAKIKIEQSQGSGAGMPVWLGAIAFTYVLVLAFAFSVYWVNGRPSQVKPVPLVQKSEVVKAEPTPYVQIESDAELAAILSLLGEEENFLDEKEVFQDIERIDQFEIRGPSASLR